MRGSFDDLVSIIIPTYNRSWGLELAIRSVLAQTHHNYELLVVDDCSEDDTAFVIQSFMDGRISYYRQPVNVGMVKNWGEVLCRARGEFVVFLSDDDQLRPDFVANRLNRMSHDSDVIVVFSKYEIRDRDGSLLRVHNEMLDTEITFDPRALLQAALSRQWFVGASMYRKRAVLKVWDQIARDDLVLDLGLNVRLAVGELGQGVCIPENDFVMTAHRGQNTEAKRAKVYEQASGTLTRILEEERESKYSPLIKRELASWHLVWGRYLAAQGMIADARAQFLKAAKIYPALFPAWKQLCASWLWPSRIIMSSRKQHAEHLRC
jgi:glycosyltransferase involved in cell wall biosynthesis